MPNRSVDLKSVDRELDCGCDGSSTCKVTEKLWTTFNTPLVPELPFVVRNVPAAEKDSISRPGDCNCMGDDGYELT